MSDLEKGRVQHDAQRAVARRLGNSTALEQGIVRHLGVELYRERRRTERSPSGSGRAGADEPDDATEGSTER